MDKNGNNENSTEQSDIVTCWGWGRTCDLDPVAVLRLMCLNKGGCQNYGPFLDPFCNTTPNISGTHRGTII